MYNVALLSSLIPKSYYFSTFLRGNIWPYSSPYSHKMSPCPLFYLLLSSIVFWRFGGGRGGPGRRFNDDRRDFDRRDNDDRRDFDRRDIDERRDDRRDRGDRMGDDR